MYVAYFIHYNIDHRLVYSLFCESTFARSTNEMGYDLLQLYYAGIW